MLVCVRPEEHDAVEERIHDDEVDEASHDERWHPLTGVVAVGVHGVSHVDTHAQ